MTGKEVQAIRGALLLTQEEFGSIFLLAEPGISRWETKRYDREVGTDGLRSHLLELLKRQLETVPNPAAYGRALMREKERGPAGPLWRILQNEYL